MTIVFVACSIAAYQLMERFRADWERENPADTLICRVKCSRLPEISEKKSLTECVGEDFGRADAIVFFCAAGIAVRSIAPFLTHKSQDPAVVVVDETAAFAIPILSGHMGGANDLARKIAAMLGAVAVITTATDREEKFAVDEFARKNNLIIKDWKAAKELSAAVLAGEKIGIRSSVALEELVDGLYYAEDTIDTPKAGTFGIVISDLADFKTPFETSCILVPRSIVAGIGCKKNTPEEQIEAAVLDCLQEEEIAEQALCAIASIDLKKQEEGILSFCKKRSLPFQTFLAEDLLAVSGSFTESEFVEKVTGVSNVCERSAVAAGGDLICRRRIYNGVTVALARKRSVLRF